MTQAKKVEDDGFESLFPTTEFTGPHTSYTSETD